MQIVVDFDQLKKRKIKFIDCSEDLLDVVLPIHVPMTNLESAHIVATRLSLYVYMLEHFAIVVGYDGSWTLEQRPCGFLHPASGCEGLTGGRPLSPPAERIAAVFETLGVTCAHGGSSCACFNKLNGMLINVTYAPNDKWAYQRQSGYITWLGQDQISLWQTGQWYFGMKTGQGDFHVTPQEANEEHDDSFIADKVSTLRNMFWRGVGQPLNLSNDCRTPKVPRLPVHHSWEWETSELEPHAIKGFQVVVMEGDDGSDGEKENWALSNILYGGDVAEATVLPSRHIALGAQILNEKDEAQGIDNP